MCACMFMSVQVYLCTWVCEDQRAALSAVPQEFFILLLVTGSHIDLPTQSQDLFTSLLDIECDTTTDFIWGQKSGLCDIKANALQTEPSSSY